MKWLVVTTALKFKCYPAISFLKSLHLQEEVVLKRCWLARYWGLAAQLGNKKNSNVFSFVWELFRIILKDIVKVSY